MAHRVRPAAREDPAAGPVAPTRRGHPPADPRWAGAVRVAAHLAVWSAVVVPAAGNLIRGFRPFSDDASIASRAFLVFSHPPTVGLVSAASLGTGHVVFDPGPLMVYLLAIPVRLDPAHGWLWGPALLGAAVLSLAVEAAWRAGGWVAAAVVAFVAWDLLWLTPNVFGNLPWNAYFPVPFLIASLAVAWLVCCGSVWWWPALVFSASVAAQSHLFFVVPAAALTLVALVCGLLRSGPRRLGWVLAGLGVGLTCWLAPLVQEIGGHPGNLTAILQANKGQPTLGVGFALREVGLIGGWPPIWLTHLPTAFLPLVSFEFTHAPWYGGLVLAALAAVAGVSFATGRWRLATLATLTFTAAVSIGVALVVFPAKNLLSLTYLLDVLWVVGVAAWAVAVWALLSAVASLARSRDVQALPRPVALAGTAGVLAAAGVALVGGLGIASATQPHMPWGRHENTAVAQAATAIEGALPRRGPVAVEVTGGPFFIASGVASGVAYRLETDGWRAGTAGEDAFEWSHTGLPVPAPWWPTFVVRMQGTAVTSVRRRG